MLAFYGMISNTLLIHCDNMSAIYISKNLVQHLNTNHTDIRHHFIREHVADTLVKIMHVTSENQLADIFTKTLDLNTFDTLKNFVGICER